MWRRELDFWMHFRFCGWSCFGGEICDYFLSNFFESFWCCMVQSVSIYWTCWIWQSLVEMGRFRFLIELTSSEIGKVYPLHNFIGDASCTLECPGPLSVV